jgi:4-hydroxybenzoate polyprenyltransferase
MLSGSEYIVNDVLDAESDRKHPEKCKRPIASGRLKASRALLFSTLLMFAALGGAYIINMQFFIISVIYFLLMLSYSIFLKRLVIVDMLLISIGFVLRAVAGCFAINVLISPWLIICAFLLALFLALGRRRHELILLGTDVASHRKTLEFYSVELLDHMINIITATLIMSYSLYTFLAESIYMMATIPLAIYGLFRYLLLIGKGNAGGSPELLFKDKGILVCIILWFVLVVLILYTPLPKMLLGR